MRATFRLSSPAWLLQPKITSSIRSAGMALRSTRARMATAARSSGRTSAREPPPARPIGVRRAWEMKASDTVDPERGDRNLGGRACGGDGHRPILQPAENLTPAVEGRLPVDDASAGRPAISEYPGRRPRPGLPGRARGRRDRAGRAARPGTGALPRRRRRRSRRGGRPGAGDVHQGVPGAGQLAGRVGLPQLAAEHREQPAQGPVPAPEGRTVLSLDDSDLAAADDPAATLDAREAERQLADGLKTLPGCSARCSCCGRSRGWSTRRSRRRWRPPRARPGCTTTTRSSG